MSQDAPPDKCPHCGAPKSVIQPEQENESYLSVGFSCGSWWSHGPGTPPRVGRVSCCYLRTEAALRAELAEWKTSLFSIEKQLRAELAEAKQERADFETGLVKMQEKLVAALEREATLRAAGQWALAQAYAYRDEMNLQDDPDYVTDLAEATAVLAPAAENDKPSHTP